MVWLWPMTTTGSPEKEEPATSKGQSLPTLRQCRPVWYQMPGTPGARCGSLASSGLPVLEREGPTTQELDPMPSPRPRVVGTASRAAVTCAYAACAVLPPRYAGYGLAELDVPSL